MNGENEQVIIFGIGNKAKRVFDNFEGLIKNVFCFLDNYAIASDFNGIPVMRPEDIKEKIMNFKIVLMVQDQFVKEIKDQLIVYGVTQNQICEAETWVAECLEDHKIHIKPRKLRLDISTCCQLDCKGCYMRNYGNGTVGLGTMKYESFRDLLLNNEVDEVEISNSGEPFLNPDLEKMLKFAYERDVIITVDNGTNFNNVSPEMLDALVKYKVKMIRCSIDGASQEIYAQYRRGGNYDRVIENIENLNSIKKKYDSKYPILVWQYILMNGNETDIEKAKLEADRLNMRMSFKLDWSGNFKPKDPDRIKRICGLDLTSKEASDSDSIKRWESLFCSLMIYQPQINWDGRLLGCCKVYRNDWKANVFDEGLLETLNSSEYVSAVRTLLTGDGDMPLGTPCDECQTYQLAKHDGVCCMTL